MSKTKRYLFYSKQSDEVDLDNPLSKTTPLSKEQRQALKDRVKSKLHKTASRLTLFSNR